VSPGWRCKSCGGDNPEGTRFCGQCGAKADTAARAEPSPDLNAALRNFVDSQVADRLIERGGRLTEERRLVTALFADISGFTALADRLDPEQLSEVIDPIIGRLSRVVGRYEGYVDKFAGDALLAFFGAPVSHEDDAVRAVLVALDMHQEMQATLSQLRQDIGDLTLHVGVNTGHVIARVLGSDVRLDYSVLGEAVILAQRLESVAPGGATYVGDATYRLVRQRFDFEPLGELVLKGKAKPVPAWRLVGERWQRQADPAPISGLVGRERELGQVRDALARLEGGQGGVLSVLGEPGIGKSRLLQSAHGDATEAKVRWLDARCLSYGAALAYWPYADLLRRVCGITRDMDASEARERLAHQVVANALTSNPFFLQQLLGIAISDQASDLQPEAFRRGLHAAVTELVAALAQENRLVLMLEDLHWADLSSLELTADVIRATATLPALYIFTGRPETAERLRALLELRSADQRLDIVLDALDVDGVRELVRAQLGGVPDAALVDMLAERTSGNPFFVEETVRSLMEAGVLTERDGRWTTVPGWQAERVPPTIEGVIAARLDRLAAADMVNLELGSVIGRMVRRPLLEAVATSAVDLDASLGRLVEGGFLDRQENDPERSVTFHHALVQSVAYNRMLRKRRRELHLLVAEAGEAIYGAGDDFIDVLARHLYLADAGVKAVKYLERAADRATRLFANAEAIIHLDHAAELARRHGELLATLPEILLRLARLHERAGSYSEALSTYSELRTLTDDIAAIRGTAGVLRKQGKYQDALAFLAEAEQAMQTDHRDLRALSLERGWSLSLSGNIEKAIDVFEATLRSSSLVDPTQAYILLELSRTETVAGRLDQALQHGLSARRIFEAHEDLPGLSTVLRIVGDIHEYRGNHDEAAEVLRQGLALARRIGNSEEIGGCLINLGMVELRRGALPEAIACDRQAAEEFERTGHAAGRATAYGNLAEKLARSGEYAEATRYCKLAADLAQAIGHPLAVADTYATMAIIHLGKGEFAEAAAQAEASADRFMELGALTYAASSLKLAADAVERGGEPARALELRRRAGSLVSNAAASTRN
jgi:class 3 adenylate cyclase/tetratricopeptide (TPR) repeat protein